MKPEIPQAWKWPLKTFCMIAGMLWAAWALMIQFAPEGMAGSWMLFAGLCCLSCFATRSGAKPLPVSTTILCAVWGLLLSGVFLVGQAYTQWERLLPEAPAWELWLRFLGMGLFWGMAARAVLLWPIAAKVSGAAKHPSLWFFLPWALIALCWLMVYLYVYPGIYSYDTMLQAEEVLGFAKVSNYHPIVHTLLLKLGMNAFGVLGLSARQAYGLMTLGQMLGLAAAASYGIWLICNRMGSPIAAILATAYFALFPIHPFYSVTLWKDIPFSAFVMLYSLMLFDILHSDGKQLKNLRFMLCFVLVQLGVLLMRKNGILILLPTLLCCLAFRSGRKAFAILAGGVAAIYLLMQGAILPLAGVEEMGPEEMLSVPMQQVSYVIEQGLPLTGEEYEAIEQVVPIEAIEELYDKRMPDYIKQDRTFSSEALSENLGELTAAWLDIIREYPAEATLAYLYLEGGYFYPDHVRPWIVHYPNHMRDYWSEELANDALIPAFSWVMNFTPNEIYPKNDALGMLMKPGYLVWVFTLACVLLLYVRKRRYLLSLLPPLVLWLSLMIGAPTSDVRYVYPMFLLLPYVLSLCVYAKKPAKSIDSANKL